MSWKAVEMQVALPRTHDAGQLMHQLQHKPLDDQSQLAGQQVKQTEQERKKSAKVEETKQFSIRDDEPKQRSGQRDGGGKGRQQALAKKPGAVARHPYKGHRIDLTL